MNSEHELLLNIKHVILTEKKKPKKTQLQVKYDAFP